MDTFTSADFAHPNGDGHRWNGLQVSRPMPIRQMTSVMYRQRKAILASTAIVFAIGAAITFAMPSKYTAIASVQLEQQAPQVVSAPDLDPQRNPTDAERFLQTQVDFVYSRLLAQRVANNLKATRTPAIMTALDVDRESGNTGVIAALQAGVHVTLGMNSRLASIEFTSRNPAVSAQVANAYADQLVDTNLATKADTSARAKAYLMGQLVKAKQDLQVAEQRLLAAARADDLSIIAPSDGTNANPSYREQLVGGMMTSLAEATARRIAAQEQWRQVSGTSVMSLPLVQENRAVQDLQAEKGRTAATLAEERKRYTSEYPTETSARIGALNAQISNIAQNVKRSYYDSYQAAARQEQSLQQAISAMRNAAMAERERGIEYNALERDVQTGKAFYDGLLQRYKEVAVASGAPAVNVTVVDRAVAPDVASSPMVARNLALAFILGLMTAMVVALIREKRQAVIRSALDLDGIEQFPFLGAIPAGATQEPFDDVLEDPRSPQSEAYNTVAVTIQQLAGGELPRSLLVTSIGSGEGASTSALSLARSLNRIGQNILLIDGDLRHPSLARLLGEPEAPGFAEALVDTASPESVVRTIEYLGFDVVFAGETSDSPVNLLTRERVGRVLDEFAARYDTVIIDGPPILGLADAAMLSNAVELVVLAVEANCVETGELSLAISRLPMAKPVGTMLTKFDAKMAGV